MKTYEEYRQELETRIAENVKKYGTTRRDEIIWWRNTYAVDVARYVAQGEEPLEQDLMRFKIMQEMYVAAGLGY